MMLLPGKKEMDLFDDMFSNPFFGRRESNLMKTDIKEVGNEYEIAVDLPGYSKENIKLEIEDGYLKVTAKKDEKIDESKGKYIHKERFFGECERTFYVGDKVKEENVKASFKDGTLMLKVPKDKPRDIAGKKYIAIE